MLSRPAILALGLTVLPLPAAAFGALDCIGTEFCNGSSAGSLTHLNGQDEALILGFQGSAIDMVFYRAANNVRHFAHCTGHGDT